MLNTYNINNHEKEYVPYVKTEQRAPTDESIKLFNEFREKAYNSIIDTIQIKNNIMEGCAFIYQDIAEFCKRVRYKIILNGKEIKGEYILKDDVLETKQSIIFDMCKKLSDEIVCELLKSMNLNGI